MTEKPYIFHIANAADVDALDHSGAYRCDSLSTEGFIHCCDKHQLASVVQRYYQAVDDVQLMLLDPDNLSSALIRENTMGGSELFPHVYGAINAEAVRQIVPFGIASTERMGLLL